MPFSSSLQRTFDVEALVFDLDGTMVDTRGDFVVALNAMLEDLHLPLIDAAFVAVTVGRGTAHLIRSTLAQSQDAAGIERLYDQAWARYLHHYGLVNGKYSTVFPGVREGLAALHAAGYPMACLTNKPSAFAGPLLVNKGLAHFFTCVFGGDAFVRQKPDPFPLVKTCEALHCAPQKTLMVGDSVNDGLAARVAGCPVVLVTYGYNHGHSIESVDCDAYVDRLDCLPGLLKPGVAGLTTP